MILGMGLCRVAQHAIFGATIKNSGCHMNRCEMLRKLPGEAFDIAVAPYQRDFASFLEAMRHTLETGAPLARLEVFKNYERYCRWPIRMLEYGFAMESVGKSGEGRALDVGSGVTPWAYWLAAQGWETTAVDLIVDEVSAMSRHGTDTYAQSVLHLMADGRGLAFADSHFDVVTCMSVIEHVPQWDTSLMLSELVRVCRPGGRLVMTTDLLAADTPFTEAESFTVDRFVSCFALLADACGAKTAFGELAKQAKATTFSDLAEFWTAHKGCGLWEEDNRGYHAVGLSFTLPESADEKRQLVTQLVGLSAAAAFVSSDGTCSPISLPDTSPLWMPTDSSLVESLQSGTFEQDVHAFFVDYVGDGDVVFDVGANVGHYTRMLGDGVQPGGEVHAFEPAEKPYQCLVRNTLERASSIRRNRFALSSEGGSREIYLGSGNNEALNSFGEPFGIGESKDGNYASETVWMMTLDSYVDTYEVGRIDLITIDVEGWEEHVVRGGVATLLKLHPVLLLEYCSPAARNAGGRCVQLSQLLVSLGYHLYRYLPDEKALESVDERRDAWSFANLVAVPNGKLQSVLARLRGETIASEVSGATEPPDALKDEVLRLELENAALRQEADSKQVDREVAALTRESNDRMAYIEHLHEQVQGLKAQLEFSEADRAARLEVIEQQAAALKQIQSHPVVKLGNSLMSVVRKRWRR